MNASSNTFVRRYFMSHFVKPRAAASRVRFASLMVAGSLGLALGAGAASAATPDQDAPSRVVRYSAAELASSSGVQDLYRRLQVAARKVCPADAVIDLRTKVLVDECRAQAVSRAIQQINNPQLAALHATSSKSG
jgi:UrcA family protein